jgi:hypothetical protein
VGRGGFEPPTSRLSSARSNQLSYQPPRANSKNAPKRPSGRDAETAAPDLMAKAPHKTAGHQNNRCPAALRKEVIQPQVPLRLPCYDFTPVADLTVVGCPLAVGTPPSGKANSHGVTGGVYKARERIHRGMLIRDY